jgi:uncharacterized small protein (DUF1192 family)
MDAKARLEVLKERFDLLQSYYNSYTEDALAALSLASAEISRLEAEIAEKSAPMKPKPGIRSSEWHPY